MNTPASRAKRTFSVLSPESPDSLIQQVSKKLNTSPEDMENIDLVLPDDTPRWARTMIQVLSQKIDNVEHCLGQSIEHISNASVVNSKSIAVLQKDNVELKDVCSKLCHENDILKDRIVKMESQSRRDNLLFFGYPERVGEKSEDCQKMVEKTLNDNLSLDMTNIKLVRVHRSPQDHAEKEPRAQSWLNFIFGEIVWKCGKKRNNCQMN
jgi:hypothetical protein